MLDQLQNVFASFQKNDVKYLVIGGIAAVLYGVPRATFDLDVLIEPTRDNAERLLCAMIEAGLGTASLTNAEKDHEVAVTQGEASTLVRLPPPLRGRVGERGKPRAPAENATRCGPKPDRESIGAT